MTTTDPKIRFSNEESKSNIRSKLNQSLINLIDLTKSTIKSSESNDLFKSNIKQFVQNESIIARAIHVARHRSTAMAGR